MSIIKFLIFENRGCPGQLTHILTNPQGPEVNDRVNLQWP